ncbi:unnamed protein product [Allacma fusca]|uniref:Uncharacterized protein n=1 Tax=Allacma fusca TaxID=39272 RepID=A0A8J2PAX0_9HEXA|nr:unnamed protein product [Allacma fusca]
MWQSKRTNRFALQKSTEPLIASLRLRAVELIRIILTWICYLGPNLETWLKPIQVEPPFNAITVLNNGNPHTTQVFQFDPEEVQFNLDVTESSDDEYFDAFEEL